MKNSTSNTLAALLAIGVILAAKLCFFALLVFVAAKIVQLVMG